MKSALVRTMQNAMKSLLRLSPKLNFLYSEHRRNRSLFRVPVETPMGFLFCGNKIMETGEFEREEVLKIRELLGPVDLFINIGANIGYYVCLAASMGKKVIAFEPDMANSRLLYKNIHANAFSSLVEVFPIALADKPSMLEIFGVGTGASIVNIWGNREQGTLVPVNSLDRVAGERVTGNRCLFLIDVEGAEHLVLKGASKCLKNKDTVWVVEITAPTQEGNRLAGKDRFQGVFRVFAENGFEPYLLSDGKKVTSEEIEQADRGELNRLANQYMFVFRSV